MEGLEEARFLAGSVNRVELLRALLDEPADLRDLKDELDMPRTTLQRNLKKLEKRGWITEGREGYSATPQGELIVDSFTAFLETVRSADDIVELTKWVDPRQVNLRRMKDVRVTTDGEDGGEPPARVAELLRDASRLSAFVPRVAFECCDAVFQRLEEQEAFEAEIVLERGNEELLERRYPSRLKTALSAGRLRVLIYDGDLPYGLLLVDDTLLILAFDEAGDMRAVLETSTEDSVEWGRRTYKGYREDAELSVLTLAFSPDPGEGAAP